MKKTLLVLSIFFCNEFAYAQLTTCEQSILGSYENEFITSSLTKRNRKVSTKTIDSNTKASIISYVQIQANANGVGNIKEIALTDSNGRITDYTFNYGSEPYVNGQLNTEHPAYEKGKQYYHISSKYLLNENCKTTRIECTYQVVANNSLDKNVLNVDFKTRLNISIKAWHNFEEIKKEYNRLYKTRTIEELKKEGIHLVNNEHGYDETNSALIKMVLREREAIINRILFKYDSCFLFDLEEYIVDPSQMWDKFYVDPIKYIKVLFENSHNLAEK